MSFYWRSGLDAGMVPMTMVVWDQCLLEELVSLSF